MADAKSILSNAFYHCGVDHEQTDEYAQEILDELGEAGYVLVFSPRKAEKAHNPSNLLQGEWR